MVAQGQEANDDNLESIFFYLLDNNGTCMLSVLIRSASMRRF